MQQIKSIKTWQPFAEDLPKPRSCALAEPLRAELTDSGQVTAWVLGVSPFCPVSLRAESCPSFRGHGCTCSHLGHCRDLGRASRQKQRSNLACLASSRAISDGPRAEHVPALPPRITSRLSYSSSQSLAGRVRNLADRNVELWKECT